MERFNAYVEDIYNLILPESTFKDGEEPKELPSYEQYKMIIGYLDSIGVFKRIYDIGVEDTKV